MITTMEAAQRRQQKDVRLIRRFVEVYCRAKHGSPKGVLCQDCSELFEYARSKQLHCPLEGEKPSCRNCRIHCYAPPQRARIKQVMAYSGRALILRGRLDYLWHYFT